MASLSILIFSQPFVKAYKGLTYVDSSVWLGTAAET